MRIATSSIPYDVLHKILWKQIDPTNIEHRKKIARFYLQSERYREARETLEAIVEAFPDRAEIQQELAPSIRQLRQLGAQRLVSELKLRRRAGQHRLVFEKLKAFPSENVALGWMQFQEPTITKTAQDLEGRDVEKILVFSVSLSAKSIHSEIDVPAAIEAANLSAEIAVEYVGQYGDHPLAIEAMIEKISACQ